MKMSSPFRSLDAVFATVASKVNERTAVRHSSKGFFFEPLSISRAAFAAIRGWACRHIGCPLSSVSAEASSHWGLTGIAIARVADPSGHLSAGQSTLSATSTLKSTPDSCQNLNTLHLKCLSSPSLPSLSCKHAGTAESHQEEPGRQGDGQGKRQHGHRGHARHHGAHLLKNHSCLTAQPAWHQDF